MKKHLLLFIAVGFELFLVKPCKSQNNFEEQTGISLTGVYQSSVAWGDYNNDGWLDVLISGMNGTLRVAKVFKNNGDNTFTEQTGILLTGVNNSSIAWADYNNDGWLDILLTGQSGTSTYVSTIYKNNGNNTFTEQTSITLTGVGNSSVAWGDYNNDGWLDIVLTGYTGTARVSKLYKNNGDNTFTEQNGITLAGVQQGNVVWGDYNNDGYLDLLLSGYTGTSYVTKLYKNNGNNTFTEQTGISFTGVSSSSLAW
ncbi:MAG: VCBS repeat-containing protein [Bacteroidota bacterium]